MEIRDVQQSLERLMGHIATLPEAQRAPLQGILAETIARNDAARAAAADIEDALADIRLTVKYMSFDLEATRRECDQLRNRLESRDNEFE